MTINLGAYSTEIIRSGIQASAKGQWEAARVLGLSRSQTFFPRDPAAVIAADLSGAGQSMHHCYARFSRGVTSFI